MKKLMKLFLIIAMITSTITFQGKMLVASDEVKFVNEYGKVGEPLQIDVSMLEGEVQYTWWKNGKQLSTSSSYVPQESDLNQFITVNIDNGDQSYRLTTFISKLPVVYIDIEDGKTVTSKDEYLNCDFKIQGNEQFNKNTTTLYNGKAEIKGRGNSTWQLPKKPYRIKLDKSTNLFGFGKSKHYVLLANYYDTSFLRNKLGYDLSGSLGMPYMQSQLVDVVVNGVYVGNYQLCEHLRVDEHRVNITNWEDFAEDGAKAIKKAESLSDDDADALETLMVENLGWITSDQVTINQQTFKVSDYFEYPDLTGGYLLENDKNYDEISKFITNSGMPIMFKSPEYANTNKDMMNYVKTYIQSFENALQSLDYTTTYENSKKHYSELFDIDSLINVWIVQELFLNADFMKNSTYMYKNHNELFKMGPVWDLDWTSGVEHSSSTNYELWQAKYFNNDEDFKSWYAYIIEDPYFLKLAQDRYLEVRDTMIQAMYDQIESYSSQIKESAQATLAIWYPNKTYTQEVDSFKQWMKQRIAFLDSKIANYDTFVAEFNEQPTKLTLTGDVETLEHDTYHYQVEAGSVVWVEGESNVSKVIVMKNNQVLAQLQPTNQKASYEVCIDENSVIQFIHCENNQVVKRSYIAIKCNTKEKELVDVEFKAPTQLIYHYGEALNLDGLSLRLLFHDGTSEEVNDYTISKYSPKQLGTQTITITYQDYHFAFALEVVNDLPFKDIKEKEWYFDVVYQAYQLKLLRGTASDLFAPDANMNRAMIACVLHRMDGEKAIAYQPIFSDVKDKIYYSQPITWAKQAGVISGHKDGSFKPNDDVTREELAIMICNFAKYKGKYEKPDIDLTNFADYEDVNAYAKTAMKWCVQHQLISGKQGGTYLDPQGKATRSEASKMLVKAYQMIQQ